MVAEKREAGREVQHKNTKMWYNLRCLTEMKHNVTYLDSRASGD